MPAREVASSSTSAAVAKAAGQAARGHGGEDGGGALALETGVRRPLGGDWTEGERGVELEAAPEERKKASHKKPRPMESVTKVGGGLGLALLGSPDVEDDY